MINPVVDLKAVYGCDVLLSQDGVGEGLPREVLRLHPILEPRAHPPEALGDDVKIDARNMVRLEKVLGVLGQVREVGPPQT